MALENTALEAAALEAAPVPATSLPASPEADRLRRQLVERVRRAVQTGEAERLPIPGLHLSYVEQPRRDPNCFYVLSVGLILQGRKRLVIGGRTYEYGAGSMIVTSIDMPTSYELLDVKPSSPFASLSLRLNAATLAELLAAEAPPPASAGGRSDVFSVSGAAYELLEDFERLLRLLERPEQIDLRAPMLVRDIHCLALASVGGACLRALYSPGAAGQRIRKAIRWLRENFRESVSIEALAGVAAMAPSTFHRHFKAFTSLSPLQYQKRLRLYEAQQFLLRGEGDVNSAAYAVGYQSPQQFNRDYKRLFGATPGRSARAARQSIYASLAGE